MSTTTLIEIAIREIFREIGGLSTRLQELENQNRVLKEKEEKKRDDTKEDIVLPTTTEVDSEPPPLECGLCLAPDHPKGEKCPLEPWTKIICSTNPYIPAKTPNFVREIDGKWVLIVFPGLPPFVVGVKNEAGVIEKLRQENRRTILCSKNLSSIRYIDTVICDTVRYSPRFEEVWEWMEAHHLHEPKV